MASHKPGQGPEPGVDEIYENVEPDEAPYLPTWLEDRIRSVDLTDYSVVGLRRVRDRGRCGPLAD